MIAEIHEMEGVLLLFIILFYVGTTWEYKLGLIKLLCKKYIFQDFLNEIKVFVILILLA